MILNHFKGITYIIDLFKQSFAILTAVEYSEIEDDSGELISIPSLIIQGIQLIGSSVVKLNEFSVEIPLTIKNISKLKNILEKVGSGEDKLRLKLTTENKTTLTSTNLIGISNERNFRTIFHKTL